MAELRVSQVPTRCALHDRYDDCEPSTTQGGTTMTDEQGYNGWKNYPTWNVNLWLSNDEPLYRAALIAAETVEGDESVHLTRRLALADHYKAWVRDELAPDLGASFAADLLGYALDQVDWLEIADAWLEQVAEQG